MTNALCTASHAARAVRTHAAAFARHTLAVQARTRNHAPGRAGDVQGEDRAQLCMKVSQQAVLARLARLARTPARPSASPEASKCRPYDFTVTPSAAAATTHAVTTASSSSKTVAARNHDAAPNADSSLRSKNAAAAPSRNHDLAQPATAVSTMHPTSSKNATGACDVAQARVASSIFLNAGISTNRSVDQAQPPAAAPTAPLICSSKKHAPTVCPNQSDEDTGLDLALNAASIVGSTFSCQIAAHKRAISSGSAVEVQSPGAAKKSRATKRLDAYLREQILAGAANGQVPEALVTAAQAMVDSGKDGSISAVLKGLSTVPESSNVIEAMMLAKRERAAFKRRAFVKQHMRSSSAAAILRAEGYCQEDILEFLPTAASLLAARRAQKRAQAIIKHVGRIKSARGPS